jgi:sarcosine oxidase subunit delta
MQIFPCPFCGPRDETEFSFAGEAGRERPQPAAGTDAARWAAYLHFNRNPRGPDVEIWKHVTCGEFFLMERDTATHEVRWTRAMPLWEAP